MSERPPKTGRDIGCGSELKRRTRNPSLLIGLVLIAILIGVSLYAIIAVPYTEAVRLWRGGPGVYDENPKNAHPVWWDWVTRDRLPRTIVVTLDEGATDEESIGNGMKQVEVVLPFEYDYNGFPSELKVLTEWGLQAEQPTISVYWRKPDGEVMTLKEDFVTRGVYTYYVSQDRDLFEALGRVAPHVALFAVDHTVYPDERQPLQGSYQLVLEGETTEENELLEARLVVYGQVHGPCGTDHMRRDLTVSLVWGAVFGLGFGILAALAWQVGAVIVAVGGRRRSEKTDPLFRRLTDVNMVLLSLPLLVAIGYFVSPGRGVMLLALLVLSLVIGLIRVLRERLVPLSQAPHTEPGRGLGTMLALLLPSFLMLVPAFVFLDAALYILYLAGDPLLPSWGSLLNQALQEHAIYHGHYYKVVQPMVLLLITALGFAMAGYALHRIYNPRLKSED